MTVNEKTKIMLAYFLIIVAKSKNKNSILCCKALFKKKEGTNVNESALKGIREF